MWAGCNKRHGVAAFLAMLYLVLFSVMAVGFYTAVTTGVQVSHNDAAVLHCRLAAESGMELVRYQLATVLIPRDTKPEDLLGEVYADLCEQMEATENLGSYKIGLEGNFITIPEGPDEWIRINNRGAKFRATIESDGSNLRVRTRGRIDKAELNRTIQLDYSKSEEPTKVLRFGVASRGVIVMDSNSNIVGVGDPSRGSVLSTNMSSSKPLQMAGNSSVSGDVSLVNDSADVWMSSGASIAGSKNPSVYGSHIHKGVSEPEFPIIDTDPFKPYAGNPAYGGMVISLPGQTYDSGTLKNVLIKANTNPIFDSNTLVQGVVYIETPNKVRFDSNVVVQGAIVVQNNPTGNLDSNVIEFNSNVKLQSVDTLPDTSDFPATLRTLNGSLILAPKFKLKMNSNFGSAGGSIVAGQIDLSSNAVGTVYGSVINLEDAKVQMHSNSHIQIAAPLVAHPVGMLFSGRFYPVPSSYVEVVE